MRNDPPAMSGRYDSPDFVGAEDGRSMLNVPQREPEIHRIIETLVKESETILRLSTNLRDRLESVLHQDEDKVPSPMETGPEAHTQLGRTLVEIYSTIRNAERVLQDIEDRIEL